MGVFNYFIKRIKLFDKERFGKHIEVIQKNTGKSKFYIKMDWIKNLILYGTGYTDYFRGDYINLTHKEKLTFVTSKSFYKILHKLNDQKDIEYLSDKIKFDKMFSKYLKRDFIDLRDVGINGFINFLKDKNVVFAKVVNGYGGHGVSKIVFEDGFDFYKSYSELMSNKQYLIEEAIIQCKELDEINPNVVNSFRVVTLYKDGKAYLLGNALRVNQGAEEVIGCTDDLYFSLDENGKIDSNVVDDYGNVYKEHPLTKKEFSKVKIPYVKKAFEMCQEAALKLPKVRYIGWDVAFSKDGPCLLEGNEYPGYGILQFYKLKGSRTGHKKEIEDIIGKI